MNPERNGDCHKSKLTLRNSESLLVNTSLGFYVDKSNKLFIFNLSGQTLKSQMIIPNGAVETLKIGETKISHTVKNRGIVITIESDTKISAIFCSYRFPFEQKFAYEKAKREEEQDAT